MKKPNFKKDKIPFTQVANCVINDKNLSFKAKGLYAYLYSKPDGWDFAIDRIAKDSKEGRLSINNGLHELEENGYLYRERQATGRVVYLLKSQMSKSDIGLTEPNVENRKVRKPQSAKTDTVSNKDYKVIKSKSNKDFSATSAEDVVAVIDAFAQWNKAATQWYNRPPMRSAASRLVENYGRETVLRVIEMLPQSNAQQFFPTITTPNQLEAKWAQLESAFRRYKQEHNAIAEI